MAKSSGWSEWRGRYQGRRAHDTGAPGRTRKSLDRFLGKSRGPLASALGDQVGYDFERDRIVVDKARVQSNASEIYSETKDFAFYDRRYQVRLLQDQYEAQTGKRPSARAAERRYNREQATRAEAVLTAARIGRVRLTEAQRRRLNEIERGKYLDIVYSQYKAGDRGTGDVRGRRSEPVTHGRDRTEYESHRRQEFRRELAATRRAGAWESDVQYVHRGGLEL